MTQELQEKHDQEMKEALGIDDFLLMRKEFIDKVNAICVEGKDYHVIQGKKSLAKGGAEKIASIFKWVAIFTKDFDTHEMLGVQNGIVNFKCTLTKDDKIVGEGRGAACMERNGGDPNKTIKMAQKSAFIDAVLRASGLSDFFTQDLEDMKPEEIGQPSQPYGVKGKYNPAGMVGKPVSPAQANILSKNGYTVDQIQKMDRLQASNAIDAIKNPSNAKAKAQADWEHDTNADEQAEIDKLNSEIPIINDQD